MRITREQLNGLVACGALRSRGLSSLHGADASNIVPTRWADNHRRPRVHWGAECIDSDGLERLLRKRWKSAGGAR